MATKKAPRNLPTLDVFRLRAGLLADFLRLAKTTLVRLAREATSRREATDEYGTREECEALMAEIDQAQVDSDLLGLFELTACHPCTISSPSKWMVGGKTRRSNHRGGCFVNRAGLSSSAGLLLDVTAGGRLQRRKVP